MPTEVSAPVVRAAMYLRISRDKLGQALGVERQGDELTALCHAKGWTWKVYEDNDKTAVAARGKGKRPAYRRMLQDIRDGKIDAVAVWDLDRLHREPWELEEFIDLADTHRLALASVDTSVDLSTDGGRLYARIKGAVARAEMDRKSARQKSAFAQRAKMGIGWGPRAFGYQESYRDEEGVWHQEVNEIEAMAIRQAYRDIRAGASLHSIARQWNVAGLRSTQAGNIFQSSGVKRVLQSVRNAGVRTYEGKVVGDAKWPAIVDKETWEAAQYVMDTKGAKQAWAADRTRKRLLGGILRCGGCGNGLASGRRNRQTAGQDVYIYRCKTPGCNLVSRKADDMDEWVGQTMIDALEARAKAVADRPDYTETLAQLNEDGSNIEKKIKAAAQKWADDIIDEDTFDELAAGLKQRLAAVRAKQEALAQAAVLDEGIDPEDIPGSWEAADIDRKRAMIKRLCSGIVVKPLGKGGKSFPTGTGITVKWYERDAEKD